MSYPRWERGDKERRAVILRDKNGEIRARLYEDGNGWTRAVVTTESARQFVIFEESGWKKNFKDADQKARTCE